MNFLVESLSLAILIRTHSDALRERKTVKNFQLSLPKDQAKTPQKRKPSDIQRQIGQKSLPNGTVKGKAELLRT